MKRWRKKETTMTPDEQQRRQAIDPSQSFIVQAPAGSGKTELLIQRYLSLLARVEAPESIVAITFTRKAAAEMASRVTAALREAAKGTPVESEHIQRTRELALQALRRDAEAGWKLLENPARMQIQTIDALCVRIAGAMPWLARLGSLPAFTEQPKPLYREAARQAIQQKNIAEAAFMLLEHRDNRAGDVIGLIEDMLGRRDQWMEWTEKIQANPSEAREVLEQRLAGITRRCLASLDKKFPAHLRERAARLAEGDDWKVIADALLTKSDTWRKTGAARQMAAELENHDDLLEAFKQLRSLPPVAFTDEQWNVFTAALTVLRNSVALLKMHFRDQKEMDFTELSQCALAALGPVDQPTDLGLAMGYRIEHLLLDEFQDTSHAQFDLIERLTAGWGPSDGRTLFLVGDPMQSIYRFRQAEVELFAQAKANGIGDIKLTSLTLSANFRSGPGLVAWVNQVFRNLMPADAEIPYALAEAAIADLKAQVLIHGFCDDDHGNEQAARMLEIIRATPEEEKIGILARTRGNLSKVVALLRSEGLRFQAVELDSLAERPVIEDLLSLTFALLHPADRISWLAILRAPWCGLTLDDLEKIAGEDPKAPVWELLRKNVMLLSPGGRIRAGRVQPILERALEQRGRRELRILVEDTWRALGGPQCVEEEADLDDAEAFFDLLERLEEGGGLADFQLLRDSAAELFAKPDPGAGEHIQLMTIHKAKGLEFDVVLLPELHRGGRNETGSLIAWTDGEDGMLAAPIPPADQQDDDLLFQYITRSEREKERAELRRLLYVAVTRARRELHLLGSVIPKTNGDFRKPANNTFLGLLWPEVEHDFCSSLSRVAPAAPAQATTFRPLRRVPESWQTPPFALPVEWNGPLIAPPPSERAITFEWVGETLRHAGVVLHAFLQRIGREGLHRWDAASLAKYRSAFRSALANQGVPENELDQAAERVEKALAQCLADSHGRWILESHREARCEAAITGVVDGRFVEAKIDRTFIDAEGARWIIDYKTSSHSGGGREKFLDNERERYRDQLERYARILSLESREPIRLGLYFPLLNGWRAWEAPAQSPAARQGSLFD